MPRFEPRDRPAATEANTAPELEVVQLMRRIPAGRQGAAALDAVVIPRRKGAKEALHARDFSSRSAWTQSTSTTQRVAASRLRRHIRAVVASALDVHPHATTARRPVDPNRRPPQTMIRTILGRVERADPPLRVRNSHRRSQSPFEAVPRSEAAQDPIVPPRNPGWRTVHTGSPIGTVKISSIMAVTLPVLRPAMRCPGGMK